MRKEEFQRRAAAMRARNAATAVTKEAPGHRAAVLAVPGLPTVAPHALLRGIWKSSHTKLLLSALGNVDPFVLRTARSIGTQQVAFDGLIYLNGNGVLDVAASPRTIPEALRLYGILLQAVAERSGQVMATNGTTITLRGETIKIRLREASERRPKQTGSSGLSENQYFPTGLLSFSVDHQQGGNFKTPASDVTNVEAFLNKLSRFVDRLPKLRAQSRERERLREAEWERMRARWKQEEDQQRQWKEHQKRFTELSNDIEQWTKAQQVRSYAAAIEAHCVATYGPVQVGNLVDGWLRWVHWYAERLDPITRPEGPKQGPLNNGSGTD